MARLVCVGLAFILWGFTVAQVCYYPDGTVADDFNYQPCSGASGGTYTSCCVPEEGDICLSNGLCYFPSRPPRGNYIYRGACTDQSWSNPACAQSCIQDKPNTYESLLYCNATGLFCCQKAPDSGSCCTDSKWQFKLDVPDNIVIYINGTGGNGGPSQPTSPSSTPPPTPSTIVFTSGPTSPPSSSPVVTSQTATPTPKEGGNKAGIIAGSVVGGLVALAALLGALCWYLLRRRRQDPKADEPKVVDGGSNGPQVPELEGNGHDPTSPVAEHKLQVERLY